jgi:putative transposase
VIAGKWYCALAGENGIPIPELVPAEKCIGLDLGCSSLITTSDGEHIAPPKYYRHAQEKRQKLARRMAKKKLGSANWRKAKKQLASLEHDVANARETFLHTLSRRLVDEYDLIAMEEDIAKGLIESDKATTGITKSITDAGWGELVRMIEYKCEELGKHFIQVPARGTTQECSGCGKVVPKKLWDRVHSCPHCGLILDRDENAARNILQRALS